MTIAEREEISLAGDKALASGHRTAAGCSSSIISRALELNGGRQRYRAGQADALAWERARGLKVCKLVRNRVLAQVGASKLKLQLSPDQIAGWLKHAYAVNADYHVSHERSIAAAILRRVAP